MANIIVDEHTPPPHNLEAEQGILGTMLISPDEWIDRVLGELEAGSFFHAPHGTVFNAIVALHKIGMPVDFITLTTMLRDRNELVLIGGPAAISHLYTFTPTPANGTHYMGIVKECAGKRKLLQICHVVSQSIHGPESLDDALTLVQKELSAIDPASKGEHVLPAMVAKVKSRFQRIRDGKIVRGEETGIKAIDYHCGGLPEGFYCALGARPGMGKSAMMEQIMASLLARGVPVCCFAQDMAPDVLLERAACRLAGVSSWRLNKGLLERWELNQVEENLDDLASSPLRLHCVERMTGETMISIARREFRKHGVKHFFLDHIQTIHVPARAERNETWAAASAGVRQFVNNMGVCWMTLAHLNREAAKERVAGHQIRGFDDLLGDVDALFLLDSDTSSSDLDPGDDWPMRFIVDKNRNGPCGSPDILFQRETMNFVVPA